MASDLCGTFGGNFSQFLQPPITDRLIELGLWSINRALDIVKCELSQQA